MEVELVEIFSVLSVGTNDTVDVGISISADEGFNVGMPVGADEGFDVGILVGANECPDVGMELSRIDDEGVDRSGSATGGEVTGEDGAGVNSSLSEILRSVEHSPKTRPK